jgi:hypothetical protein
MLQTFQMYTASVKTFFDNDVQHSGILLTLTVVGWRKSNINLVSKILLCCQCTLKGATSKRLRLFSQDIGVDAPPFPYLLTNFQENYHRKNPSRHYSNEVVHYPVERITVTTKENRRWPLQTCETQNAPTNNPGISNCSFFCYSLVFGGTVCTVVSTNRNVQFMYTVLNVNTGDAQIAVTEL